MEETSTTEPPATSGSTNTKRSLFLKWRNYTRGLCSPDSYINFGFYYIIGCALQRRVWTGADHMPLFPNTYPILVGHAGVGKGLVLRTVDAILRHHKLPVGPSEKVGAGEDAVALPANVTAEKFKSAAAVYNSAMAAQGRPDLVFNTGKEKKENERPLLFPVAAKATTYEALIKAIAKAVRRKNVDKCAAVPSGIYTHSSICFCLEELGSLFRKHTDDTVTFLQEAYDCGDYEYDTKTQGTDLIKKTCVSLLGGATPEFMEKVFRNDLLGEGFASRAWFLFEHSNRFKKLFPDPLTEDQVSDYNDILAHVKLLADLYGYAPLTEEARAFMTDWWENINSKIITNVNPKLAHYFSRKNIHALKLATAIHFSRVDFTKPVAMEITKDDCIESLAMLGGVEKKMHYALQFDKTNPLAKISKKVEQFLEANGPQTHSELLLQFWDDCKDAELGEILNALLLFGKIETEEMNKGEIKYRKRDKPPEEES